MENKAVFSLRGTQVMKKSGGLPQANLRQLDIKTLAWPRHEVPNLQLENK